MVWFLRYDHEVLRSVSRLWPMQQFRKKWVQFANLSGIWEGNWKYRIQHVKCTCLNVLDIFP